MCCCNTIQVKRKHKTVMHILLDLILKSLILHILIFMLINYLGSLFQNFIKLKWVPWNLGIQHFVKAVLKKKNTSSKLFFKKRSHEYILVPVTKICMSLLGTKLKREYHSKLILFIKLWLLSLERQKTRIKGLIYRRESQL